MSIYAVYRQAILAVIRADSQRTTRIGLFSNHKVKIDYSGLNYWREKPDFSFEVECTYFKSYADLDWDFEGSLYKIQRKWNHAYKR